MTRDELLRAALVTGDALDDLQRARIWARVEDELATPVARSWWRAPRPALAIALAVTVVSLVAIVRVRRPETRGFTAPRDATLALKLGPYARASLVGPAQVDVLGEPGEVTSVALRHGTLIAEFEGGPGRALRISAPGASVEIVGTLFAVEAHAASTCVAVAHGRVRMTTSARVLEIGGGETACSDQPAPHPSSPEMRDLLARHAMVIAEIVAPAIPVATPLPPPVAAIAVPPVAASPARATPPPAAPDPPPAQAPSTTSPAAITAGAATRADSPGIPPSAASTPHRTHAAAESPRTPVPVAATDADVRAVAPASPQAITRDANTGAVAARTSSPSSAGTGPALATATTTRTTAATEPASAPTTAATEPASATPRPDPAPSPVTPPISPPSDAALYREAEAALARHDLATADRTLARLVDELPGSPLLDQALYERARIADQRHAWDAARRQLARLATLVHSPLREPGAYLTCRIAVESGDPGADAQLVAYRASYPHSPHDLDVLGLLVDRAYHAGRCARAAALVDELARLYQGTTLARSWRARCP